MGLKDIDLSHQIAHVRIHIERVIGRLKKYQILVSIIPESQVDLLDVIIVTIAGLINLNKSHVKKKKKCNNKIFLLQTKYCNHQLKAWAFTNAIVFLLIIIINIIFSCQYFW